MYAYNQVIKPMLTEYDPQLVIVSAGFDCAQGDPLGGLHVTPAGFNHLTYELTKFADGKVVIALEGGYNLKSISKSMVACLRALLGEPLMPMELTTVCSEAIDAVEKTISAHRPHWKCFDC